MADFLVVVVQDLADVGVVVLVDHCVADLVVRVGHRAPKSREGWLLDAA